MCSASRLVYGRRGRDFCRGSSYKSNMFVFYEDLSAIVSYNCRIMYHTLRRSPTRRTQLANYRPTHGFNRVTCRRDNPSCAALPCAHIYRDDENSRHVNRVQQVVVKSCQLGRLFCFHSGRRRRNAS